MRLFVVVKVKYPPEFFGAAIKKIVFFVYIYNPFFYYYLIFTIDFIR